MKREHGGGDEERGRNKRQRADGFSEALAQGKFELRLLVSSKCAGAIIGKGGENIKRIRTQFDGFISVPDSNTPERVLTLTNTPEAVVKMLEDVLPRLEEPGNEAKDKTEVRLLVHQSHAGALIGRQGSRIKELRESTNTRIKVHQNTCPQSTDRVVVIGGDENSVLNAVSKIIEDLRTIPIKGSTTPYSSFNYDPMQVSDYGGFPPTGFTPAPPGKGPMNSRFPPRDMGPYGGPPFGGNGRNYPPMGMGVPPPPHDQGGFMNPPPPMYGNPLNRNAPPQMSGGGGYGSAPSFGSHPPPGGPVTTTQVTIPTDLAGAIIGRNGERINKIRDESRANITLEKSNGSPERIITLSGTASQIYTAQFLLQDCVRSSPQGKKFYENHR